MSTGDRGSVSQWLDDLKAGEDAAVQPLWERYYVRLVRLARMKLRVAQRTAAEDEEDAALSAFNSFCVGAAQGRFPRLADRDDLWRLLVVITARKAGAQLQREGRKKRGGGRVVAAVDLAAGPDASNANDPLAGALAAGPSPDFAAAAAEQFRRLLDALADPELQRVALDRMEGYTNDEIAERLGCARRTVARRVDLIKQVWQAEAV